MKHTKNILFLFFLLSFIFILSGTVIAPLVNNPNIPIVQTVKDNSYDLGTSGIKWSTIYGNYYNSNGFSFNYNNNNGYWDFGSGSIYATQYYGNNQQGTTDCYDSALGGQVCSGGGIVYSITDDPSDKSFKSNVKPIEENNNLSKFSQLKPSTWKWANNYTGKIGQTASGLVAQDVQELYPDLVKDGQHKQLTGYKNVTKLSKVNQTLMVNSTTKVNQTIYVNQTVDYITQESQTKEIKKEDAFEDVTTNVIIKQNSTCYDYNSKTYPCQIDVVDNSKSKITTQLKKGVTFDKLTGKFTLTQLVNVTKQKVIQSPQIIQVDKIIQIPNTIIVNKNITNSEPIWNTTTYKTIDYAGIIALQISKIQQLETENNQIKDCTLNSKDFDEYKRCIGEING